MIEFPYLVMFRNENGHFVSVGGGCEFKTEKEATAKAKEKCDELNLTVYVMEARMIRDAAHSDKERSRPRHVAAKFDLFRKQSLTDAAQSRVSAPSVGPRRALTQSIV